MVNSFKLVTILQKSSTIDDDWMEPKYASVFTILTIAFKGIRTKSVFSVLRWWVSAFLTFEGIDPLGEASEKTLKNISGKIDFL